MQQKNQKKGQGISDDGIEWIAQYLAGNHSLKSLDLSCNNISSDGMKTLADVLSRSAKINSKNSCSLTHLSLRGNRITDRGMCVTTTAIVICIFF